MGKQSKMLLDRAAKYIAKGLERGAYTDTVGSDLFAERLLEQIRLNRAKERPHAADEKHLLERAAKYIAKGLESGAYTDTVGSDLFAERLLKHLQERSGGGTPADPPKSKARIKQEVDEVLAKTRHSHATQKITSEDIVAQMIGRHVKSGWYGLVDGEILQWEPFGAGGTDVLVKDVSSGKLSWHASHSLTPIDGRGPLPSRTEVRKIREAEMATQMKKIAERWAKEPPPPRIRR